MGQRVNPNLITDLKKFGLEELNSCFHCGTCTAVCSLTQDGVIFPRKQIRSLQMGLKSSLASNVEPWMCYYCGDCNEECPRDVNPGEFMMSLRRYLTSIYDWTGISGLLYKSKIAEFIAIFAIAALVLVLSIIYFTVPTEWATSDGSGFKMSQYIPVHIVHIGDLIMAGLLAFFLLSNVFNMFKKVILDTKTKVPLGAYFTGFWDLIIHFITQKKFKDCKTR